MNTGLITEQRGLVSVIIPCFNQAHFLPEAINSVLAQTYPEVEVIVVDDASSDATSAVAAGFQQVVCLRQRKNGGLANARNVGLNAARGEYIVFLDADDWLLPEGLASGVRCLSGDATSGFAFGLCRYVRADRTRMWERKPLADPTDMYAALLTRNVVEMIATVLFRREAILQAGGLDTRFRACEDYDLLLRIARDRSVLQHDAVVACYRMHEHNMSRNHALMLATSVRALRKQRVHASRTPRWQSSYAEGLAFWKSWYGTQLFEQIRVQAGAWRTLLGASRNMVTLMYYVGILDVMRWLRAGTGTGTGTRQPGSLK